MMDFRSQHRALRRLVICMVPVASALWSLPHIATAAGADASIPSSTGRTAAPRDTAAATDETIMVDVRQALAGIGGLDASRIDVRSVDGVVRLQGAIRDESQRAAALKAAKDVRGVSAVSDELRVARSAR
ncbi:BON domain-containing protein [Cupriavidus sp. D384]|uniref:BON domain-containing protein n=1 Tax=Cupriavidus sp. D384 TaxID=1538095 RepID=UPI000A49832F|nr:BON domain-containing protein [Cupriavidus sp. D384]